MTANTNGGETPRTDNAQDSVIAKVRKLLALAGNNPNENEAASAMAKAQEILAAHNLSMAQLNMAARDNGQAMAGGGKREKAKVERSAMFKYQRDVWQAMAEASFCVYWAHKVTSTSGVFITYHHYLIGREDNVATVRVMGEYLEGVINRLCPYKVGKDVNLWKQGCAERLAERIREEASREDTASQDAAWTDQGQTSTMAVTLRNVRDAEAHANHAFQYGDSSWCPCATCRAKRNAEYRARMDAMPARTDEATAYTPPVRKETDRQRQAREDRERRESERYWSRWARKENAEREKRGSEAFQRGRDDAETVRLNKQVGNDRNKGGQ